MILVIQVVLVGCKDHNKVYISKNIISTSFEDGLRLDNEIFFNGGNFPAFMQKLQMTGGYNEMLKYTSRATINQFGKEKLLNFYSSMQFSYPLNLKAIKKLDGYSILFFQTKINATVHTIKVKVSIESDNCRICFDSLDYNSPFMFEGAN